MTKNEISKKFASRIKDSVKRSTFNKGMVNEDFIKTASNKGDSLLVEIKKIYHEIENLEYSDGTDLNEKDKNEISTEIADILGLENPEKAWKLIKEAGNDNALALTSLVSQIINE